MSDQWGYNFGWTVWNHTRLHQVTIYSNTSVDSNWQLNYDSYLPEPARGRDWSQAYGQSKNGSSSFRRSSARTSIGPWGPDLVKYIQGQDIFTPWFCHLQMQEMTLKFLSILPWQMKCDVSLSRLYILNIIQFKTLLLE